MSNADLPDSLLEGSSVSKLVRNARAVRMQPGGALHLISSFEAGMRLVPIKPSQQSVKVIRSVVVRGVARHQLGKESGDGQPEVAGQVAAHLAAAVRKAVWKLSSLVNQKMPRRLNRIAGQHQCLC